MHCKPIPGIQHCRLHPANHSSLERALRSAKGLSASSSSSSSVSDGGVCGARRGDENIGGFVAADGRGGGVRRGVCGDPMLSPDIPDTGGLVGELGSFPLAFSVATSSGVGG